MLSFKSRRPSSNRSPMCMGPDSHTQLANICLCLNLFLFIFGFLGDVAFPEYYLPLPFPFCMESKSCVFFPSEWCFVFPPCDHGLDF